MLRTPSATLLAFALLVCDTLPLVGSPPRRDVYGDPLPEGARMRMGTVQLRHNNADATFSTDGRTLISCGRLDGVVRFWDVASGRLVREMQLCKTPREKKELLSVTLRGRCAAMKMKDTVILRDVESGAERGRLALKAEKQDRRVIPSADGKFVLVLENADPGHVNLELWDVARVKKTKSGNYLYGVDRAVFSGDGKRLALNAGDAAVHLWDTATGKQMTQNGKGSWGHAMCFSPDGKTLAVNVLDGPVKLLDAATLEEQAQLARPKEHIQPMAHLEYSADGKLLAGDDEDGIVIWDVAARTMKHRLQNTHANALAFAPDGKTLAYWGWYLGNEFHLWDVAAGKPLHARPGHAEYVDALAVSPDSKIVASGAMHCRSVHLWDTATGRLLRRLQGGDDWITNCTFTADGKQLVSSGSKGTIQLWDVARGSEMRRLKADGGKAGNAFGGWKETFLRPWPDGKHLSTIFIENFKPAQAAIWDLITGKRLSQRPYKVDEHRQDRPGGGMALWIEEHVAFAGDGQSVTVRNGEHLAIEDVKSGRVLAVLPESVGRPVAISPAGHLVAVAALKPRENAFDYPAMDGIRLIEAATGQEVVRIPAAQGHLIDFSHDGRWLATIDEKALHIWNVASGEEQFCRLWPKSARVSRLAFLLDGSGVVTGMNDGTVLIWDVPAAPERGRPASAPALSALWSALAGEPRQAHRAIYTLAGMPADTVAFFAKHLRPAAAFDAKRVEQWLADLDSEQFAVRESAQRELTQHRDDIETSLRRFREGKLTLEVRRRIEAILAAPRPVPPAAKLRTLRAIRVLEQIGTAEARELLRELAAGAAAARETQEAKKALQK